MNANVPIQITAPLGLHPAVDGVSDGNGNHIFLRSEEYLAAALFAGGQQLYTPSPVQYSYTGKEGNWSVTPISISSQSLEEFDYAHNNSVVGNLTVETYGINTNANCQMASISFSSDNITIATVDGCSYNFSASTDTTFPRWHFADTTPCGNSTSHDFAFNAFVFAVYRPSGYLALDPNQFSVMICRPTIQIQKVSATMSISNQGIGALIAPPIVLETFAIGSNASDPGVASLLQPPLNGMALNGYEIAEPANASSLSRTARANITREILYEGIYGAMTFHLPRDNPGTSTDWCG
jgi:hypothetical protein